MKMKHHFLRILIFGLLTLSVKIEVRASEPFWFEKVFPVGVALIPEFQFPDEDVTAYSRFSWLYGRHDSVYGVDLGVLGNMTNKTSGGIAFSGLFNINRGNVYATGLQFAGLVNWNTGKTYVGGVQASLFNMNGGDGGIYGLQLGGVNYAPKTKVYGLQLGLYNEADRVTGFQIGLINVTKSLRGIQLGLININKSGIPFLPGINIGF